MLLTLIKLKNDNDDDDDGGGGDDDVEGGCRSKSYDVVICFWTFNNHVTHHWLPIP